jgi:hypothetical protein
MDLKKARGRGKQRDGKIETKREKAKENKINYRR